MLGNTCVVYIKQIVTKFGIEIKRGMLGNHIRRLQNIGYRKIGISKGKFDQLVVDLNTFNGHLNLIKHSIFEADEELIKPSNSNIQLYDYDRGKSHCFSRNDQEKALLLGSTLAERLRMLGTAG